MAEAEVGAKAKGGRIMQSRYLQYDQKATRKADSTRSSTKGPEKAASAKKPPAQLQRQKKTSETGFTQLHSTVVEDNENAQFDWEFSAITNKSQSATPLSKSNSTVKGSSGKQQTLQEAMGRLHCLLLKETPLLHFHQFEEVRQQQVVVVVEEVEKMSTDADDLAQILESQTLLLTYASIKMEKNRSALEAKAERNLLALSEEREKLQREVHRKKRRLLQLKKEQDLCDALDRQIEVLAPVVEQCAKFHDEYKHFATALDSTRHELPLKDIHTGENQDQYLADLQEHLTAMQNMLKQNLKEHSEHNAQALPVVKELAEASLKLNNELPRSVATLLELSSNVSKEVTLHQQKTCEDTMGLEAMKKYYFP